MQPILLSEEEGVEKPSREIFIRALERVNAMGSEGPAILPEHCLHVGDELKASVNACYPLDWIRLRK